MGAELKRKKRLTSTFVQLHAGSWVELGTQLISPSPVRTTSVTSYSVERLLREAQKESSLASSCITSRTSSRALRCASESSANDFLLLMFRTYDSMIVAI